MKLTDDLPHARWMVLKAILFLVAGVAAIIGVLVEHPHWRTALLLGIAIWSFCRLYYFAFYVIEKYIDPSFKFAGLASVVRHLRQSRRMR
jgi:Kef-type K+ transport system membrane component KefB